MHAQHLPWLGNAPGAREDAVHTQHSLLRDGRFRGRARLLLRQTQSLVGLISGHFRDIERGSRERPFLHGARARTVIWRLAPRGGRRPTLGWGPARAARSASTPTVLRRLSAGAAPFCS